MWLGHGNQHELKLKHIWACGGGYQHKPLSCTRCVHTFLFRGEQKHTLGGLPVAQQTFDREWKHACSAVMDNDNKKFFQKKAVKELAGRSADTGQVSCPKRPDTISTFRGTRQDSQEVWESWDLSQQRDRCCFLWQPLTFKSATWNWNCSEKWYSTRQLLLRSCCCCHYYEPACSAWYFSVLVKERFTVFTHHFSRCHSRRRSETPPELKGKNTNQSDTQH